MVVVRKRGYHTVDWWINNGWVSLPDSHSDGNCWRNVHSSDWAADVDVENVWLAVESSFRLWDLIHPIHRASSTMATTNQSRFRPLSLQQRYQDYSQALFLTPRWLLLHQHTTLHYFVLSLLFLLLLLHLYSSCSK